MKDHPLIRSFKSIDTPIVILKEQDVKDYGNL